MKPLSVCIRCNAGHKTGYGHVSRCLALAKALSGRGDVHVFFALDSPDAAQKVAGMGFEVYILSADKDADGLCLARPVGSTGAMDESLMQLVEAKKPDIFILDARPAHNPAIFKSIKRHINFLADLDDTSEQRFAADVVYLPPAPAVERLDWQGFSGVRRIGFKWILTGANFSPPPYRAPKPPYRLLMTMGGSDPWRYTRKYAPLFAELCGQEGIMFALVVGPGFAAREDLIKLCRRLPGGPQVFDSPVDMGKVYAWCDMALVPTSVSAYELAMSCKKCLYLCPDAKYREYGAVFEKAGLGRVLNLPDENTYAFVKSQLRAFVQSINEASLTPDTIKNIFAPDPAQHIANDILTLWKEKN